MNPYAIDGPAVISFSGGRSSGFMLWNILEAHKGMLPDDVKVIFANTGLEHHETYEFIHRIEKAWCDVVWLEYALNDENKHDFKIVDYKSASRNGEPFEQLIQKKKYLPNPVARICTADLKIRTISRYLKSLDWIEWFNHVGLRADEQRRVQRLKNDTKANKAIMPMSEAGHDLKDVQAFWDKQKIDLKLPINSNIFGNCVGCYLKGYGKLEAIARHEPDALDWWIETERKTGIKFRIDRPDYATIKRDAHLQQAFDFGDSVSCFCTD